MHWANTLSIVLWLLSFAVVSVLRHTFDAARVNMNVGAGPLFPMPEQKMGAAYTAVAPSMVTVSDTLQQSEYATDVRSLFRAPT